MLLDEPTTYSRHCPTDRGIEPVQGIKSERIFSYNLFHVSTSNLATHSKSVLSAMFTRFTMSARMFAVTRLSYVVRGFALDTGLARSLQ